MFPERFNNKTNGVTPRRWLLLANPDLARLITEAIGDGWVTDLGQLQQLVPLADDAAFRDAFRKAKRAAKARFADWLKATTGQVVDPERSSTARSSASTSTSGSCSTCCTSSCSTTACAPNPNARRAAADVLLRRQGGPGLHWPS